jgi:hypothetical protein
VGFKGYHLYIGCKIRDSNIKELRYLNVDHSTGIEASRREYEYLSQLREGGYMSNRLIIFFIILISMSFPKPFYDSHRI